MRTDRGSDHLEQKDPITAKQWLEKPEAAVYLNTTQRFIDRLITERRIPFYKFGKFVRISREDLDAFANRGRVEARR